MASTFVDILSLLITTYLRLLTINHDVVPKIIAICIYISKFKCTVIEIIEWTIVHQAANYALIHEGPIQWRYGSSQKKVYVL